MKVIVINGSPKGSRSNTWQLTQAFISGLNNIEEIIEYDLNQLKISKCLGCFHCWKNTPGKCVIQDDMQQIIPKLIEADLIIWSFPLYYFNIPGPLKSFIDRRLPMVLPFMDQTASSGGHPSRYDLSHQKNILISTCGFYTAKGNYDSVTTMFDRFLGHYETIFCGQGELFRVPELSNRTNEYLNYVKKAGEEYSNGQISIETRKHLDELLFPKETFEAMADASWGVDKETGDQMDESLIFTKQMAALYNKAAYKGKDIVLEMNYTDINKTYQIILGKDKANVITDHFQTYTTRIETPYTLWLDIASNKIRGDEALMKQMYRVEGDFNLMIHWGEYFGSSSNKVVEEVQIKTKTNMQNVLLPWILFWIFGSDFSKIPYLIIALIIQEIILYKTKKTIYDNISKYFIFICIVILLLDVSSSLVLPLSYLGFGLMWALSCKTKIPLTAHYSANDYGGENILENPIFIKTNLILTLLWGILYIAISIWTFFFMKTPYATLITTLNSMLPLFLGIFTVWFQKWYPAKIARGK